MPETSEGQDEQIVMKWKAALKTDWVVASLVLGLVLAAVFFPVAWGGKTLLASAWDASSVMPSGAYTKDPLPDDRVDRTLDSGAPAWTIEPWIKVVSDQYWTEHNLPLWNPYGAYGTPLAAAMQAQPFYPLTVLLSLHPTAWTYNFFIIARLLVAGLLMFLFARLFLPGLPSLFAAITFMLTGYFIVFLNMPHLSVEVLLPGVFLAFELILRKNSWRVVAGTAGVILLCMVGGMPESVFLVVSFGCLYFLLRLMLTPEFREHPFARLGKLTAAVTLGFALSGFLLLPFLEFVRIAHDTHQPANLAANLDIYRSGLVIDGDVPGTVMYLLPMIFGSMGRGYWGVLPCFFAVAAILCWFFPKRLSYPKPLRSLIAFFAIMLALMLLKRFGHPIINWIGLLPLSEMVVYVKYQEPLMAFCVAMLAGIGFFLLSEARAKPVYFLVAAVIVLDVMLALAAWSIPRVPQLGELSVFFYVSVLSGVVIVFGVVWLIAIFPPASTRARAWLARSLFGILLLELSLNFIVPNFYVLNTLPSVKVDPYVGAPYIDFLRARNIDHSRIFGREDILFPNWAGVFHLDDVRSLDAMYYRKYTDFIRSFLLKPGDEKRRHGDLADQFTGSEFPYAFDTDVEKRFLALSSIRYLISASEYGSSSTVTDEILAQHEAEKRVGFGRATFPVGSGGRPALGFMQHPPSERVTYKTVIDPQRPIFEAIAAIVREAHDKSDGAGFLLEVRSDGNIEKLFSTVLNPKEVPADRAGRPVRVDLSAYAGKEVELLFSTDAGPLGNNAYDWAGWAKARFVPKVETPDASSFKPMYFQEVYIYEVPWVLPRASLFGAVEVLPEAEVLARLKDPAFNPAEKIVLSRESLSSDDLAAARPLTAAAAAPPVAARIEHYESQLVRVEAETAAPAVLMLTDANYPGWRAYVNGKPASVLYANYLFRGVILSAGMNTVEFKYEPRSFYLGGLLAIAALVILAVLVLRERSRRRAAWTKTNDLSNLKSL